MLQFLERQRLPRIQIGQLVLQRIVIIVLRVLGLFVDLQIAIELQDRSGHAEVIAPIRLRLHIDDGLVEDRGHHLGRYEAPPDELIQAELLVA